MPERKYTYTVEIDAASTRQAAQQLRAIFEQEIAAITAQATARAAAPDQGMRQAQQAAETTRRSMEQIAQIDLTAGTEKLQEQLLAIRANLNAIGTQYERMQRLSSAGTGPDARQRANMETYFQEVARAAGDDAAAAARRSGRALNIGQMNAEFKNDEAELYFEQERDTYREGDANTEKRRHTVAEREILAGMEAEMLQGQLDAIRVEKALEQRRLTGLEERIDAAMRAGQELPDAGELENEIKRADQSLADLTQQETEYLEYVRNANQRLADATNDAAAKVARDARTEAMQRGEIVTAGPATGSTSQTVLAVSAKSAENAERLAAAMREAAAATERQAAALQNASRREWELDTIRQRSKIEQGDRIKAEQQIEAERTAQAQVRAEIARTTNTQKAEGAERLEAAKGESRARVELAKGESRAIAEAGAAETARVRGEEARRTAILKSELKERERAAATSARQQSQGGASALARPFGMSWGQLATGAAATLGIYGIDQVARGTFDAGFEGAQQLRQMETFEALAQRVGVSSVAVVRAIRTASRETVTETDAMGLAAQVLSQRFAASSQNIAGDLETLVQFSRRASQIYTDESGAFLSTQDVFTRLIKFAREGNKELVDQFGLSNQAIAAQLGTTVSGLAGATGAADRWRGMILLLDDELKRLGQASVSTADQFEADIARIDEEWNRLKRSLAQPVAAVVTVAADLAEGTGRGARIRDPEADLTMDDYRTAIEEAQAAQQEAGNAQQLVRLEYFAKTVEQIAEAQARGVPYAQEWANSLKGAAGEVDYFDRVSDDAMRQLERISAEVALAAAGQDAYSIAMSATTMEAIAQSGELNSLARALGDYQNLYIEGKLTLQEYTAVTEMLAEAMRHLAGAAGLAAVAVVGANNAIGSSAKPNIFGGPAAPTAGIGTPAFSRQQQSALMPANPFDARAQDVATIREDKKRADEKAAKEAERAWESAAKKAQTAFEAAAQSAAGDFKAALESVPGLFGTSEVTAEDMALAAVGGYQDKADERLRVLADEVLNKKDTPEDPADWARRMGLDPSTDPRRVLAEAQARWADSSLFAGGANLDLLNRDAIAAALARGDASKAGKNALLAEFGLGEDSPLDAAGKGALQEMLGLGEQELTAAGGEARAAFDAGFYAPAAAGAATATGKETAGMAATLAQQLKTDIEAGEIADALYSIGGSILGRIHAGYEAAAANADWSDALIASLAADVAPIVIEAIADQLPPKT